MPQPQPCRIWAASSTCTEAHGNTGSLTHWARPNIEPTTSWFLVGFVSAAPQWKLFKIQALPTSQVRMCVQEKLFSGILNMSMNHLGICRWTSFILSFRAAPGAYGGSQTRGWIEAIAAGLHHSHSNASSFTRWARPGIKPASSWFLVRFISTAPQWELLKNSMMFKWGKTMGLNSVEAWSPLQSYPFSIHSNLPSTPPTWGL